MGRSNEAALLRLASRQHSAFTRAQAVALGVFDQTLSRRVRDGVIYRAAPGVYRLVGVQSTFESQVVLAVLSSGEGAAASHHTAAYLHGLMDRPRTIEVVTSRNGIRRRDFALHYSSDLVADHVTRVSGIETTTPERTVIDIGVPHGLGATARVIDEGRRRGKVDLHRAASLLHQVARRGRNGVGPARRIISERLEWDQITDSQLEDRFLRLVQRAGLPLPMAQHVVIDNSSDFVGRVDFAYVDAHVAIELDSLAYHSGRRPFQKDRQRQNRLVLAGWRVLRFTWWDVMAGEEFVLDSVQTAIRPKL